MNYEKGIVFVSIFRCISEGEMIGVLFYKGGYSCDVFYF